MNQPMRIADGLNDQKKPLRFTFDGKDYSGLEGDTLASALIANGVHLVGRSFKYHRPRGIFSAGSEEPNALVTIGQGARATPNTRATTAELYDGLTAISQNRWPSLQLDLQSVNDLVAPFLTAGFYYKTFMWPAAFWEKLYEPAIRRAAGLGSLSGETDPDSYDKGFLHCDILVVGAGPAGLMAASTAARAGARVILADEDFLMGGRLNCETIEVDGIAGSQWAADVVAELSAMPNVRLMSRMSVFGVFDHGVYSALERNTDHLASPEPYQPRETLWRISAKHTILAAGAIERPMAFGNNDRPGVMLASAVRTYANRYGALAGKHIAVFTNNDDGLRTGRDLENAGAQAIVIDTRENIAIAEIHGRQRVRAIKLTDGRTLPADCVAVSGGWNPSLHLTCHKRGRPEWREDIAAFVPDHENLSPDMRVVGAANGTFSTYQCLAEGASAGADAARLIGKSVTVTDMPEAEDQEFNISPFWHVASSMKRAWIDLQNDVTVKDVVLAEREGFRSVEHLKRYTTLGMATDQGKTANVLGLAVMAEATGRSIPQTGTTIFRPPYTPVSISAFAGESAGKHFRPYRLSPSHKFASEHGASFVETGAWLRAQWFAQPGENHWRQSVDREVSAVRGSVGVCDVTTLGKIDIQGTDAAEFLNHVYINAFAKLAVGKCRYGLMLREDGMAMDDGTVARLAETHFLMTTTTANAVSVYRHLEFCRQCLWPDLDVHLISATDQWAQYAIAGPNSRKVLEKLVDADFDISNEAFPYMACGGITICGGTRARLFRLSFSGELAYELAVPARYGDALMRAIMIAGEEYDIVPYGTEALGVMRIEKGHAAGNELNGQTTARNLGMARMVSKKKDCIGKTLAGRAGLNEDDGYQLVGFKPVDKNQSLVGGAHFMSIGNEPIAKNDEGYMTSVAWSPSLGMSIGLGFIARGDKRIGEKVCAVDLLREQDVEVEICSAHFIDPDGERLRG